MSLFGQNTRVTQGDMEEVTKRRPYVPTPDGDYLVQLDEDVELVAGKGNSTWRAMKATVTILSTVEGQTSVNEVEVAGRSAEVLITLPHPSDDDERTKRNADVMGSFLYAIDAASLDDQGNVLLDALQTDDDVIELVSKAAAYAPEFVARVYTAIRKRNGAIQYRDEENKIPWKDTKATAFRRREAVTAGA